MARVSALAYGVICYAIFLGTFLYAIWFVHDMDSLTAAPGSPWVMALVIDAIALAVFALQHSIMARQGFKRVWTKVVPRPIERPTYVLFSSAALILMYVIWKPLPGVVWNVESAAGQLILNALYILGWLIVLTSTFLIDHFELFGLKQVWRFYNGKEMDPAKFKSPGYYRFVRHPIYFGFIIAFWSTPTMTTHHLLFSVMTLGYILVAIQLEERDLVTVLGEQYQVYRSGVSMLVPWPRK